MKQTSNNSFYNYGHILLCLCCCALQFQGTSCQTTATQLSDKLFTNYLSSVRPFCGDNALVPVRLDIGLRQIIDLDEPTQILTLSLWIRLMWTDCQLTWNKTDYGNISSVIVPFKQVWVPDLTLYDSTATDFPGYDDYRPSIYSDGSVYYNFPTIVESRCTLDVSKFPYDEQKCILTFGSWAYHGYQMDLVYKNPYGDLSSAVENVEWNISKFTAERHVVYYGCCPEPYPDVTFYLYMKRKPLYYLVNIIIPTLLITTMGILGFFLPAESGEKVSLEITVMLALAVFQLLVADSLPPSANNTPLIAIYFNFCLFLVGFACVMAVIVLTFHYKGDNSQMPKWVIAIFLKRLSKVFFVTVPEFEIQEVKKIENKSANTEDSAKTSTKKHGNRTTVAVQPINGSLPTVHTSQKTTVEEVLVTGADHWKALGLLFDRMSCLLFIIIGFIGTCVVFTQFK